MFWVPQGTIVMLTGWILISLYNTNGALKEIAAIVTANAARLAHVESQVYPTAAAEIARLNNHISEFNRQLNEGTRDRYYRQDAERDFGVVTKQLEQFDNRLGRIEQMVFRGMDGRMKEGAR